MNELEQDNTKYKVFKPSFSLIKKSAIKTLKGQEKVWVVLLLWFFMLWNICLFLGGILILSEINNFIAGIGLILSLIPIIMLLRFIWCKIKFESKFTKFVLFVIFGFLLMGGGSMNMFIVIVGSQGEYENWIPLFKEIYGYILMLKSVFFKIVDTVYCNFLLLTRCACCPSASKHEPAAAWQRQNPVRYRTGCLSYCL